jgi:hypothetical protein
LVFDPVLDSDDAALLVRHDCRILSASEAQTVRIFAMQRAAQP